MSKKIKTKPVQPLLLPISESWHMDRIKGEFGQAEKVFLNAWSEQNENRSPGRRYPTIAALVQNPEPRDYRVCAAFAQWLGTNCGLSFLSECFMANDYMKRLASGFISRAFEDSKKSLSFIRIPFVQKMNNELLANAKKGDWNEWQPNTPELISEINHHVAKLRTALMNGDSAKVSEYAADVANFCMKADEIHGA